MTTLHIGTEGTTRVTLPLEAVTQTFGIVAVRGAGKTNTAVVMTEELIGAGSQVVVLDPLDVWWGLRASADGKGAGLPVYVFGGEHADLPLDAAAGKLIADVIVEQGISAVISMRHLSKSAQRRFVADFAERLYDRKGAGKYQTPLHVVIDEADAFAPQRVMADTARMLGAIDDLVRRGRNAGFGVTLITQRPATLNKDVLAMVEALIVLRTISPQDRKALDAWIVAHDSEGHRAAFMASLAGLQRGEAWLWSPGWLDVFRRVRIRQRRTYDSSATPKAGEQRREPKRLAPVDIDALRGRMAAVIEEAAALDPKKLQARIAQLERELAKKAPPPPASGNEAEIERLETIIDAKEREIAEVRESLEWYQNAAGNFRAFFAAIGSVVDEYRPMLDPTIAHMTVPAISPQLRQKDANRTAAKMPAAPRRQSTHSAATAGDITAPQARVINAAGALHAFGLDEIAGPTLAAHAGYRYSGGFRNILSELRTAGLLIDTRPKTHRLTEAGIVRAEYEPISDAGELRQRWLDLCSNSTRPLLTALISAYPEPIAGPDLAMMCGREYSGGFRNLMSELCTMAAATRPIRGHVRASDALFPEGLR